MKKLKEYYSYLKEAISENKFEVGETCIYVGDKVDFINTEVKILEIKIYTIIYDYKIRYNDGLTQWVPETYLQKIDHRRGKRKSTYIETEPDFDNIEWWSRMKENKLFESEDHDVGRKVKIKNNVNNKYKEQAYGNGGDGYGVVTTHYDKNGATFEYEIVWNNRNRYLYNRNDFDFVDDDDVNDDNIEWWARLEESIDNEFLTGDICIYNRENSIYDGRKVKIRYLMWYDKANVLLIDSGSYSPEKKITVDIKNLTRIDNKVPEEDNIEWWARLEESFDTPSGITSDVKITVDGNRGGIIERLIKNMDLIVQKRKIKSLRIKSINGYFNKETFTRRNLYFDSYLEIDMINKDNIIAEYKSIDNSITIRINDQIVYDMESKYFDNEVLIDRIVIEYKKHLKNRRYGIRESYIATKK